jgi:hypothetical protein
MSNETRFTAGPWFYGICHQEERGAVPLDYEAPGYYDNTAIMGADGTRVVGCDEYHVFGSQADVALLLAAPDLYAALERSLSWLTSYQGEAATGKDGPYEQARAALAKARGETA